MRIYKAWCRTTGKIVEEDKEYTLVEPARPVNVFRAIVDGFITNTPGKLGIRFRVTKPGRHGRYTSDDIVVKFWQLNEEHSFNTQIYDHDKNVDPVINTMGRRSIFKRTDKR